MAKSKNQSKHILGIILIGISILLIAMTVQFYGLSPKTKTEDAVASMGQMYHFVKSVIHGSIGVFAIIPSLIVFVWGIDLVFDDGKLAYKKLYYYSLIGCLFAPIVVGSLAPYYVGAYGSGINSMLESAFGIVGNAIVILVAVVVYVFFEVKPDLSGIKFDFQKKKGSSAKPSRLPKQTQPKSTQYPIPYQNHNKPSNPPREQPKQIPFEYEDKRSHGQESNKDSRDSYPIRHNGNGNHYDDFPFRD